MSSPLKASPSRSLRGRFILLASATALVVSSFGAHAASPVPAAAAPAGIQASSASDSDFGARKRMRRGGQAAGLAMMGLMVGTIGAAVAAQQRRDAYESYNRRAYGYYGHPHPYVRHHPQPYVHYQPQPYVRHYPQPHVHQQQIYGHAYRAPVPRPYAPYRGGALSVDPGAPAPGPAPGPSVQ